MKRRFRLRKSSELKRVRREGKTYAHPLVVLQVLDRPDDRFHIGIVATRSLGNAVKRNYAKRRLREALRPMLKKISPGRDLVLVARPPILQADFETLTLALNSLLSKANLLD